MNSDRSNNTAQNISFEILTQICTKSTAIDVFSPKWTTLTRPTQKTSKTNAMQLQCKYTHYTKLHANT